jgi:circadian clock protein KaiC
LLRFAVAAAERGERALIYSFEERLDSILSRCAALHIDIEPLLADGRLTIQTVDPAELTPGQFAHDIRALVEKEGIRFIGIDSLNGYMLAMPEERFLLLHLHEVLTYLGRQGVVSVMVMAQHGLLGSMAVPVDVSYIADTVLLLRFFEAQGSVRKAISVTKKRSGAHETTIREFSLGSDGVRVGAPLVEFHGILSGVPTFRGAVRELIDVPEDDARD